MNIKQFRAQLDSQREKFRVKKQTGTDYQPHNRMILAGLEPYGGPWTQKEAAHLARRTLFGASPEDISALVGLGKDAAVNSLLKPGTPPTPPVNNYQDVVVDPDIPFGQTWVNHRATDDEVIGQRVVSLKGWWIENMIHQERTIEEKMIFFWHNHLVTESWGVFWPNATYRQIELFRSQALGNFKQLVYDVTIDLSMLIYLNGIYNSKEAPDENYARELQELFCIGKGPNAGYTEDDVKSAARVLTGWSLDWDTYERVFNTWAHDTDEKQFSSFYQHKVIQGQTGQDGRNELDDLIDMIFDQQECAMFFCRKLYRFFVYSEIDENTEQNIIAPMAQILRDNDYEIQPVLDALFKSAHFYTDENIGACVKSPLDFLIGFWRSTRVKYPAQDLTSKAHIHTSMLWNMSSIGLEVLDPPNVAGYPAYYQIPQFDKHWITTDTVPYRAILTDSFVWWGFWSQSVLTNVDVLAYVTSLNNAAEPELLIDEACQNLLAVPLTAKGRAPLRSILLSGQMSDHYWTDAWLNYLGDPTNEVAKNIVEVRLKLFFQRLFQMSEFHLT
jgi:uncharacterized protein (DUF1800 family)